MKKSIGVGISTLLILVLGAAAALAGMTFSPSGLVEVQSFPHKQNVSVTFTDTSPHLCQAGGTEWEFWVEDETGELLEVDGGGDARATGSYVPTDPPNPICPAGTSKVETIEDVLFSEPGSYTLFATRESIQGASTDEEDDAQVNFQLEQELVVSFPAAPSVAARILANNDEQARYGSGRNGGNLIADVAQHMGTQSGDSRKTDFDGVSKSTPTAYKAAVCEYLKTNAASPRPGLDCDA